MYIARKYFTVKLIHLNHSNDLAPKELIIDVESHDLNYIETNLVLAIYEGCEMLEIHDLQKFLQRMTSSFSFYNSISLFWY